MPTSDEAAAGQDAIPLAKVARHSAVIEPVTCPRGRRLDFHQAVAYLGLETGKGDQRLRQLVATKRIPVYRDGRLFFFDRELDEWLDRRRSAAVDEPRSTHIALDPVKVESVGIEDLLPKRRRLGSVEGLHRRTSSTNGKQRAS